ncbi:MAG: hypothetical protein RIB32_03550 [Phycisphaerales bacterium]
MTSEEQSEAPLMLSVSGCRGIVGRSLTPETIARFASTLAGHVRVRRGVETPTVVLGGDGRRGGDLLQSVAAASLAASGCRVIRLRVATTPTVGVMVLHHQADAGLVVTASHNPGEWNGLKAITAEGSAPLPDEAAALIERFRSGATHYVEPDRFGEVVGDDTAAHVHVAHVLRAIERIIPISRIASRRFRVVLDSVNASGALAGRMLLEALGCEIIHVNADGSGIFPHPPEPTRENLREMATQVRINDASVGFAQDPDADRLALIDASGRYIGEEYTLALGVMAVLSAQESGAVTAANLSTSRMIDDVAALTGARVLRTPVGEANLVRAMRAEGCIVGGEGNGGVIWPEIVSIRDSLAAMALTLALMTDRGASLAELVDSIPSYSIEKRKMPIREGLAATAMRAVRAGWPDATADDQDGLRLDFTLEGGGQAWIHVRASNTEPIFRLIAEAPTDAQARAVLDRAESLIAEA